MKLYHYTTIDALKGILQIGNESDDELCFWATRFDCFDDNNEFKYGIECTQKKLLDLEIKSKILPQDRVSGNFIVDNIINNEIMPKPYIVSLCKNPLSDKMWENYADQGKGVVLEFDMSYNNFSEACKSHTQGVLNGFDCLYDNINNQQYIDEELANTYNNNHNIVSKLSPIEPLVFKILMSYGILYLFCPRIKQHSFIEEDEYRLVLSVPDEEWLNTIKKELSMRNLNMNDFTDLLNRKFPTPGMPQSEYEIEKHIKGVKRRKRDLKDIWYRELYFPKEILVSVIVKNEDTHKIVSEILSREKYAEVKLLCLQ